MIGSDGEAPHLRICFAIYFHLVPKEIFYVEGGQRSTASLVEALSNRSTTGPGHPSLAPGNSQLSLSSGQGKTRWVPQVPAHHRLPSQRCHRRRRKSREGRAPKTERLDRILDPGTLSLGDNTELATFGLRRCSGRRLLWAWCKRLCCGMAAAPLVWCWVAAAGCRLCQILFRPYRGFSVSLTAIRGTERTSNKVIILLLWTQLGFRFQCRKSDRGPSVADWHQVHH